MKNSANPILILTFAIAFLFGFLHIFVSGHDFAGLSSQLSRRFPFQAVCHCRSGGACRLL